MSDAVLVLRGAAAWLAAATTVGAAMALRAQSDGPAPGALALLLAMALLALAFWPLTASVRRLPALGAAMVAAQLAGHALLLYASTGRLSHGGGSGLVCCPPTTATAAATTGPLGHLTAEAGWWLLAVQLVVALLLTVPVRLLHKGFLALGAALAGLAGRVLPSLRGLAVLLDFTPVTVHRRQPRPAPRRLRGPGQLLASTADRRGPPAARALTPLRVPSSLRGACAA